MQEVDPLCGDVDEEVDGTRGLGDSLDVGVVGKRGGGRRHGGRCVGWVVGCEVVWWWCSGW